MRNHRLPRDKPDCIISASHFDKGGQMKVFPYSLFPIVAWAMPAFATVTVTSPTPGALVPSPGHYVATASTTTCAKGVATMGIYVNNVLIYVVKGTVLNT